MAINFPNSPSENDTYLDDNGRLWLFKNGYWQETILSFSIDLLRDVHTIVDTQSITFVDSTGFESSINANEVLPFILADDTVSNIPFTPYELPFYIADGTYDGIDIIKDEPELNSNIVWDGTNWVPQLLVYDSDSIVGLNTSDAVVDDTLVWQDGEYVTDNVNNYITYNVPDFTLKISEIESVAGVAANTDNAWYNLPWDTTHITSDVNMVDLPNGKLICTADGLYEISFIVYGKSDEMSIYNPSQVIYAECYVYKSDDSKRHQYTFNIEIRPPDTRYSDVSTLDIKSSGYITDYIQLYSGDYMKMRVYKNQQSLNDDMHIYGRMFMNKISEITPIDTAEYIETVCVDCKNHTIADPLIRGPFPAGTYEMRPKVWTFTASSPYSGAYQFNVRYESSGGEITERLWSNAGFKSTAILAFQAVLDEAPTKRFTLTSQQSMLFWFYDTNYLDNSGGSCFELYKIV